CDQGGVSRGSYLQTPGNFQPANLAFDTRPVPERKDPEERNSWETQPSWITNRRLIPEPIRLANYPVEPAPKMLRRARCIARHSLSQAGQWLWASNCQGMQPAAA